MLLKKTVAPVKYPHQGCLRRHCSLLLPADPPPSCCSTPRGSTGTSQGPFFSGYARCERFLFPSSFSRLLLRQWQWIAGIQARRAENGGHLTIRASNRTGKSGVSAAPKGLEEGTRSWSMVCAKKHTRLRHLGPSLHSWLRYLIRRPQCTQPLRFITCA